MTLQEAIQSVREGNFVSHKYFNSKQSMHEYKGNLYYEDGALLTSNNTMEWLQREEWAKTDWYIKFSEDKINKDKLKDLHDRFSRTMLPYNSSYEECVI
jgi:hypothetical protein